MLDEKIQKSGLVGGASKIGGVGILENCFFLMFMVFCFY